MGYRVQEDLLLHPNSSANCPVYDVYEHRTETKEKIWIKRFMNKTEAKSFSRHLNLGGGFDGWTPDFFRVQVVI
jgi:hypothetical protein